LSICCRASWENTNCFAAIVPTPQQQSLEYAHHVAFAHDEQVFAIDFDFSAGVLSEEHMVTWFHIDRVYVAVLQKLAVAHGDDLAPDWLLEIDTSETREYGGKIGFFKSRVCGTWPATLRRPQQERRRSPTAMHGGRAPFYRDSVLG
jgi:hypothetical protein